MNTTPEVTFSMEQLRSAAHMKPTDEEMLQFVEENPEWAGQALRSAYADMRLGLAKERAAQEETRLRDLVSDLFHNAPHYLRQLKELEALASHNGQGITEGRRSSARVCMQKIMFETTLGRFF